MVDPTLALNVKSFKRHRFALAAALLAGQALAQQNRNVVVLDPAHGGQDAGIALNGQAEKDVTLAFAASLRTLLSARGFNVAMTREAELPASAPLLTTDQRASLANHLRPVACFVLHATGTGTGVHLASSSLPEPTDMPAMVVPWEAAQTAYLAQSQRLANDLAYALLKAKVPVMLIRASIRPLDNLTCPAVVIEVAPLAGAIAPDPAYLQHVAETLAGALLTWRDLTSPHTALNKAAPTP